MEGKTVFQNPIQIGMIVKDLDQALEQFDKILGIGNFRINRFPPEGQENTLREYRGRQGNFTGKFSFYNWGNIELEIIQPISGDSVWFDYLEKTPNGMGIHHVKFLVDDNEETERYLKERNIGIVMRGEGVGPNSGKIWSFYDTFERLGFDVETLTRKPVRDRG